MKTYKAKNGKEFRLAGIEQRHEVDFLTIFWIETQKYEEFLFKQVEPQLEPFERQPPPPRKKKK